MIIDLKRSIDLRCLMTGAMFISDDLVSLTKITRTKEREINFHNRMVASRLFHLPYLWPDSCCFFILKYLYMKRSRWLIKSMLTSALEFSPSSFPPVTVIRAALRPYKALEKVNATLSTICTMQVLSMQRRKMLIDEQEWILLDKQCTAFNMKHYTTQKCFKTSFPYFSLWYLSTTGGPESPIIAF